jgi:Domain of unknown function (DUF3943)
LSCASVSIGEILRPCFIIIALVAAPLVHADPTPDPLARGALALGEIEANNIVVNVFDRSIIPAITGLPGGWAETDLQTAWVNVSETWRFDEDPFPVNEIVHPIEGSQYFAAGRSNGFGFWESSAGTAFGAVMWKVFGEVGDPMINDIITTTLGGAALGEMLHRIYVEADREDLVARYFVAPIEAGNEALFGKDRAGGDDGRLSLSFEMGLVVSYLELDATRGIASGFGDIAGEAGDTLIYGDPYGGRSAPFDYFEERFALAMSSSFYGLSFFSNGTLYSLPIVDTRENELSLAAGLHYDYVYSSLIELEANAVGLSLIGEHHGSGGVVLKGEAHISALALGTDENEYFRKYNGPQGINEEGRDYDFCFGGEAKVYLSASEPRFGTLSLEFTGYDFRAIPGVYVSSSPAAPLDYSIVGILDVGYERNIAPKLGIGIDYLLYFKDALYDSLPEIEESFQAVTVYARLFT